MFSYICKIKTPDGDKLYKGDLPFLPKIGEAIHFNNNYRVVDIVYHFFSMHDNKIAVTILVEKET